MSATTAVSVVKQQWRVLLTGVQFLTTVPVRIVPAPTPQEVGNSLSYYPLIGLLIGAVLWWGGVHLFAGVAVELSAALTLVVWVIITGGLHLDGLADSADAWHGGRGDPQRMLAIMKDPHCGPAAVVWVVLTLLTKYGALVAALTHHVNSTVLLAPCLGRAAVVALLLTTPYVRASGLGTALADHHTKTSCVVWLGCIVGFVVYLFNERGILMLLTAMVMVFCLRRLMLRSIGGLTGDTAGALVELTETVVLVVGVMAI